jgi:hypothetical protein
MGGGFYTMPPAIARKSLFFETFFETRGVRVNRVAAHGSQESEVRIQELNVKALRIFLQTRWREESNGTKFVAF